MLRLNINICLILILSIILVDAATRRGGRRRPQNGHRQPTHNQPGHKQPIHKPPVHHHPTNAPKVPSNESEETDLSEESPNDPIKSTEKPTQKPTEKSLMKSTEKPQIKPVPPFEPKPPSDLEMITKKFSRRSLEQYLLKSPNTWKVKLNSHLND